MKIRVQTLGVLAAVLLAVPASIAKDSSEIMNDANSEAAKADAKSDTASREATNSVSAIADGNKKDAAHHAKKAAKEQKEAISRSDKAQHLETKAEDKAVKEAK